MAAQPTSPRANLAAATAAPTNTSSAPAEAKVEAVATLRLEPAPILTATPLAGVTPESYDVQARFNRANDYLNGKDKENARRVFQEIIDYLQGDLTAVESLLMTACCQIGAAHTYPNGAAEKSYLAAQGKEKCDQIFANRASWSEESKKSNYTMLIKSYDGLLFALPPKDPARQAIQAQLQACRQELKSLTMPSAPPVSASPAPAAASKAKSPTTSPRKAHAPSEPTRASATVSAVTPPSEPPFDVQASYKSAKESLANGKNAEARSQFDKIIQRLSADESEDNSIEDLLILTGSAIGNACTFQQTDNAEDGCSRARYIDMAVRTCDEVYNRRWNPSDTRKNIEYYEGLKEHYNFLVNNVSDEEKAKIIPRLSECTNKAIALKKSLASTPAPASTIAAPLPPPLEEPAPSAAVPTGEKKVAFETPFNAKASYTTARSSLANENYEQAQAQFDEIINKLKEPKSIEDFLILAGSQLGYARSIQKSDTADKQSLRQTYIGNAAQTCDTIYQMLESASALNPHKKIANYEGLSEHYSFLEMIVSDEERAEIAKRLSICRGNVDSLKAALTPTPPKDAAPTSEAASAAAPATPGDKPPSQPPGSPPKVPPINTAAALNPANPIPPSGQPAPTPTSPSTSPRKPAAPGPDSPRKVTPGPVGSSSTIRVIFGISIAAILAAIAGVVIYRRWVVKK
jgi:TolA-binding protein